MGGTDDPSNLIELTIEEHAEAHRKLYEEHGNEFDRISHLCLSGAIDKEEIIFRVISENGKRNKGNKRPDLAEYNTTHKKGKKQSPEQAVKSRENAMGNKSRVGQKRPAEETRKVSETLKAKYASGEMIHWTQKPEHAHRLPPID